MQDANLERAASTVQEAAAAAAESAAFTSGREDDIIKVTYALDNALENLRPKRF